MVQEIKAQQLAEETSTSGESEMHIDGGEISIHSLDHSETLESRKLSMKQCSYCTVISSDVRLTSKIYNSGTAEEYHPDQLHESIVDGKFQHSSY